MKTRLLAIVLVSVMATFMIMTTSSLIAKAAEGDPPPGGGTWGISKPDNGEFGTTPQPAPQPTPTNPPTQTTPQTPTQNPPTTTTPTTDPKPDPPKTNNGGRTELPKTGGSPESYILLGFSMLVLGTLGAFGYGEIASRIKK